MGLFGAFAVSALGTPLNALYSLEDGTDGFTATFAQAQLANYSPTDNVRYSVNIPASSASSGSGDIYFQIQAPSTYQWVGLGQGTQMKGANIFIIYSDESNNNVTLSPRLGKGEFEPEYSSAANVTLLAGSGIANGTMTANVRCELLHPRRDIARRLHHTDSLLPRRQL